MLAADSSLSEAVNVPALVVVLVEPPAGSRLFSAMPRCQQPALPAAPTTHHPAYVAGKIQDTRTARCTGRHWGTATFISKSSAKKVGCVLQARSSRPRPHFTTMHSEEFAFDWGMFTFNLRPMVLASALHYR